MGTTEEKFRFIPPSSPHPEMEIGIGIIGNGQAVRVYLSRQEAREVAKEILRVAGSAK
jgi:hypothetical protein